MTAAPALSVVMAVYNGADCIAAAIDSILSQTFRDFEFIIVDDGSTDGTGAILSEYAQRDARIRIVTQANTGLTRALNIGAAQARGRYIARQDADDVSYPDRFARQISYLDSNPDIGVIGSAADDLYPDGTMRLWRAHNERELQNIVFLKTPFPHSTAMMRAETFRALGGYDENFVTAQDMELWMRFARHGRIAMVDEPLIRRTIASSSISQRRRMHQFHDSLRARWRHNRGWKKIPAVFHALRSFAIGFLPPCCLPRTEHTP